MFERHGRRLARIRDGDGRKIEITSERDLIRQIAIAAPGADLLVEYFSERDWRANAPL